MQTLDKIKAEVTQLTVVEQDALLDWLDRRRENRFELMEAFKAEIEAGQKDIAEGRYRVRHP